MADPDYEFHEMVYDAADKCGRFEGDAGVQALNKLAFRLGYEESRFAHGSCLERMLADNPGMQQAMIEWLAEQQVPEWAENLEAFFNEEDPIHRL